MVGESLGRKQLKAMSLKMSVNWKLFFTGSHGDMGSPAKNNK